MSTQQTTNPSYLARWEKHLADLAKNDAEHVGKLEASYPSDLTAIFNHAITALEIASYTARWHHGRAMLRKLERKRATRALLAAAHRCDELASDLSALVAQGYLFTVADWPWLEMVFDKAWRSRPSALAAAERDYEWHARAIRRDDFESAVFDQLYELENMMAMPTAFWDVAIVADAIRFTLDGLYSPAEGRSRAAEAIATSAAEVVRGLAL